MEEDDGGILTDFVNQDLLMWAFNQQSSNPKSWFPTAWDHTTHTVGSVTWRSTSEDSRVLTTIILTRHYRYKIKDNCRTYPLSHCIRGCVGRNLAMFPKQTLCLSSFEFRKKNLHNEQSVRTSNQVLCQCFIHGKHCKLFSEITSFLRKCLLESCQTTMSERRTQAYWG